MNYHNLPHDHNYSSTTKLDSNSQSHIVAHRIPTQSLNNMTLNEVFEYYVDYNPLAPAIFTKENSFTYDEIEKLSNQLAHLLRSKNVGKGSFVAIYFTRSERPIISILGVLKAGATYVPLDPSYPKERIDYILSHVGISIILTENDLVKNIDSQYTKQTLLLNTDYTLVNNFSTTRLSNCTTQLTNQDLSYILFTSGTTGTPKGIMTEHRNVVQFSHVFNKICKITPQDRIYQGFALVFDGSVEEIWMAFGSGASLVISDSDIAKLGEETAQFMNQMQVTIFSTVPTFLSLIKTPLTSNRLIIVSGEPCPPALVDKWAINRRMLNVYGPTETTVNTTVKECFPKQEVTIGKPLPGYKTYILDKNLLPVADGQEGELYIGGVGVARGYFKLPELTAKHYISNPFSNDPADRLYKTGDLVKKVNGEIHFLKRIDTQVKIRGFRIELSEINSLLEKNNNISLAVTKVIEDRGQKKIASYITLKDPLLFELSDLLKKLKGSLPHYMIPSFIEVLSEFPRLPSGKIDIKSLPKPTTPFVDTARDIVTPTNQYEVNILSAWKTILNDKHISTTDNFFTDLGGDSLTAIETLSEIRKNFNYEISIRDFYSELTIKNLALKAMQANNVSTTSKSNEGKNAQEVLESVPKWERLLTATLQALSLFIFFTISSAIIIGILKIGLMTFQHQLSLSTTIYIFLGIILFGYPLHLATSITLKWIIIGRYKAGHYPIGSFYYFRCWLASKVQTASGINLFTGTPVINLYYRLLGASIGSNTIIDSSKFFATDLITIGNNCCIGANSDISAHHMENGEMILGPITIEDNCFIGNHSYIAPNVVMKSGSKLDDLSALYKNTTTQADCSYSGAPAKKSTIDLSAFNSTQSMNHPILRGLGYLLAAEFIGFLFFVITSPIYLSMVGAFYYQGISALIMTSIFWSIFGTLLFCLMVAAIKFILMKKTIPGVYSTSSFYYLRKWTIDLFMDISNTAVHSLYTTIYLPSWLRLLGAKIGKMAEISTVTKLTPDLIDIGAESFFADGSIIGGRRFYNGQVQYGINKIGRRSFVGNNAMLPIGESLGDNCLLGVLSTPPKSHTHCTPNNSEWLGSPSFNLPHRNKVTSFSHEEMFAPTKKLIIQRLIIDGLRIMIPNFIALISSFTFLYFAYFSIIHLSLLATILLAPFISLALLTLSIYIVAGLKKVIMGTFTPTKKPLWSTYVWFNELINGVYETVAAPLMTPFMGTPFYNWYLRLMGCKIGKHSYIATSLFSEFDLVHIGDYCTLNSGVIIQNHLFEDRVMKSSHLNIKDGCTIGSMSIVLYDSVIEDNSYIEALSLVMKGDQLPTKTHWQGIPVTQL